MELFFEPLVLFFGIYTKQHMKQLFFLSICSIYLCSCEKDIDFELKDAADVLVVDAQIENGQAPVVILSKSLDYYTTVNLQTVSNSFVRNAVVTVTNGIKTNQLKEYAIPLGGGYNLYYYTNDNANTNSAFVGELGKGYALNIVAEGKNYQAITEIPLLAKVPDSLWFKRVPNNTDTSLRSLMLRIYDPPGLGNYLRYYTAVNTEGFAPGENSVFSDEVIDGKTYELEVEPGRDRNNANNKRDFFKVNDTVTLKISNINRTTYLFWNTWEFAQQSIGNPFSQPNKVLGNVSNGALGAFCGYAAWTRRIIAK